MLIRRTALGCACALLLASVGAGMGWCVAAGACWLMMAEQHIVTRSRVVPLYVACAATCLTGFVLVVHTPASACTPCPTAWHHYR